MMKNYLILAVMLAATALLFSGCAQQPQEGISPPVPEKAAPKVTLETAPTTATAGEEMTISWRVSGDAATTPHTAIHYGPSSVPNPTGPQDYPKATPFQCQVNNCPIPSSFSAKLKISEPGTYYYRAHAVVNGENVWSEEKAITIEAKAQPAQTPETPAPSEIEPKILITSAAPAIAGANQAVSISWKIESESTTTPHTAVHYGTSSVPNPTGPSDYPLASSFICTATPCSIPRAFHAQIAIANEGTYHYRAHAIIDGKNFWSEEKTIEIVAPEEAPATYGGGGGGGGY